MILDYLGGSQIITKLLLRGRQERAGEIGRCCPAGCADGGRGRELRDAGDLHLEKARKWSLP